MESRSNHKSSDFVWKEVHSGDLSGSYVDSAKSKSMTEQNEDLVSGKFRGTG